MVVVLGIGGGIGYWIYIASRPKKMTWDAHVYQLGDGVVSPPKDSDGKIIADYRLSDLRPYAIDVAEKIDKKDGSTRYWLQKLKKAIPVVTADCVEKWGEKKWVRVLLEEDTCTLIKAGYDRKTGAQIFRPLPHDRITMINTEYDERKTRIEAAGDILSKITPWIVAGIAILGLVMMTYFQVQGMVKISENNLEAAKIISTKINALNGGEPLPDQENPKIIKEEVPTIPP